MANGNERSFLTNSSNITITTQETNKHPYHTYTIIYK